MSALNFVLSDGMVIIATDSLASSFDGIPRSFQTKVFPLPHVCGVICGTGLFQLTLDWFVFVQQHAVTREVSYLSRIAPQQLPLLAAKYEADYSGESTIYHFGWDAAGGHFRGFAHRSTKHFAVEEFERPRWALKPGSTELLKTFEETYSATGDLTQCFVETIKAQRARDLALPADQRVGIGGEIHLLNMSPTHQYIWNCFRFEHFEDMFNEMLASTKAEI